MLNQDYVLSLKNKQSGNRFQLIIRDEGNNVLGNLRLLQIGDEENSVIVESLTKWRNRYMQFFLTQFEATNTRTQNWLKNTVFNSDDRLMFLIYDDTEKLLGNFGIANIATDKCELDNLIRGEKGGHPKLIYYSELTLLSWLFNCQDIELVNLHVFSNNAPTIRLHTSVGFKEINRSKLCKFIKDNGDIVYSCDFDSNKSEDFAPFEYIEMAINSKSFASNHPAFNRGIS